MRLPWTGPSWTSWDKLESLEAEGFYLFLYLFEAFVVAAGVGHLAVVVVEVDESSSVALKCAVVLVEEGL